VANPAIETRIAPRIAPGTAAEGKTKECVKRNVIELPCCKSS